MYPGGYATGTQYAIDRANSFRGDCGSLAAAPEPLLEPVMGVGIVVERGHLAEAGAAVQRDSLTELLVRLQAERRQSELTRLDLERIQHAPPDPQPTHRVGDPHPFQRADTRANRLHDATGDGLSIQRSEKERTTRRDQVTVLRWQAGGGIEPGLEPPLELGKVLGDAPARAPAGWIDPLDLQTRDAEQKMRLRHCRNQPLALFGCEGVEQCSGRFVRPRIHLLDFTLPQGREPCLAHALIAAALTEPHQAFSRQRLGETTDVAGVEPKAPAQLAELRALPTDLVEQARRAQRAVAAEKVVVERADPLGDEPVEAPHLGNLVGQHCLTVVKYTGGGQRGGIICSCRGIPAGIVCCIGPMAHGARGPHRRDRHLDSMASGGRAARWPADLSLEGGRVQGGRGKAGKAPDSAPSHCCRPAAAEDSGAVTYIPCAPRTPACGDTSARSFAPTLRSGRCRRAA